MPGLPEFFYTSPQGRKRYTRTITGEMELDREMRFLPAWVMYISPEDKQQTLILSDWSARDWSKDKILAVQNALKELMDKKYRIYLYSNSKSRESIPSPQGLETKSSSEPLRNIQIKRLLPEDLSCLEDAAVREAMKPCDADEVLKYSRETHNFTKDEIFILNDYWVKKITNTAEDPFFRSLSTSEFIQLDAANRAKLIRILQESSPKVVSIIHDEFSTEAHQAFIELQGYFPQCTFYKKFRRLVLNREDIDNLLKNNHIVTPTGNRLSLSDCALITDLVLLDIDAYIVNLHCLFPSMPQLSKLKYIGGGIKTNKQAFDQSISQEFTHLEELSVLHSEVWDLSIYLKLMKNLKKLSLQKCREFYVTSSEDLEEKLENSDDTSLCQLENLEEIDVSFVKSHTDMHLEFKALFSLAPNLKILNISGHPVGTIINSLQGETFDSLEEVSFSQDEFHIKDTEALLNCLKARVPNLKRVKCYVSNPQNLEHAYKAKIGNILNKLNRQGLDTTFEFHKIPLLENLKNTQTVTPPNQPQHHPESLIDLKPTPIDAKFQYLGKHHTKKNQDMLCEKLSQYLTITSQHVGIINKIQDGICNVLAHFFIEQGAEKLDKMVEVIFNWDVSRGQINAELIAQFEILLQYIDAHDLHALPVPSSFLGGNLSQFLQLADGAFVLKNANIHSIAVSRSSQHTWIFYDPNHPESTQKVYDLAELEYFIELALGSLISVELSTATITKITESIPQKAINPKQFLKNGGLLTLLDNTSQDTSQILKQIPLKQDFSAAELNSLLMRNVKGIPAWVSGIKSSNLNIALLTKDLLEQFMEKVPHYKEALQKSLEVMTALERHECITQMVQVRELSSLLYTPLIALLRTAPEDYEKALQPWNKEAKRGTDIISYSKECMEKGLVKKRLIKLGSREEVNGMYFALEEHAKNTHRPLFYVHSADELVCNVPFIERKGEDGIIKSGDAGGGKLYDFLKKDAPVVVVDYDKFEASEIVSKNELLNKDKPRIDKTLLPKDAIVIGLINTNDPDCYQGSDLYRRFDIQESCPVAREEIRAASPVLPILEGARNPTNAINLFHSSNWKDLLLGRWMFDGKSMHFEEGALKAALEKSEPIEIQNGLWNLEEFQLFWQEAILRGKIEHEGRTIVIPKTIKLIKHEGYDWAKLAAIITDTPGTNRFELLNPGRLNEFLPHLQYDPEGKTLKKTPGFIEANKDKSPLNVYLSRPLSEDEWAKLLTECERFKVQLKVHAQRNTLPKVLNYTNGFLFKRTPWDETKEEANKIIISNDMDATVAKLSNKKKYSVIDVSECNPADLLLWFDGGFDEKNQSFQYDRRPAALLEALKRKEPIILKGNFSLELQDQLASLLFHRQKIKTIGELILVSSQTEAFQYLPREVYTHEVSAEEKRQALAAMPAWLEERLLPFMHEPFYKIKARRMFWEANPEALNSEDTWLGFNDLLSPVPKLEDLDPQNSAAKVQEFIENRRKALNAKFAKMPYVFIAGYSGGGKTTFIRQEFCQNDDLLYERDKIEDWIDNEDPGRKFLFIDEATLDASDWSNFEGLFQDPPRILYKGQHHTLSKDHKVIFAGNPVSSGDERRIATLFERHGNALVFDPFPTAFLYEKIVKPVFANTLLKDAEVYLFNYFLEVYQFIIERSPKEPLISPRELQMMALMTCDYCEKNRQKNPMEVAAHYAYSLSKNLVLKEFQQEFDTRFKPKTPLEKPRPVLLANKFLITASRFPIYQHIKDCLELQQYRQKNKNTANDAQLYGGLGGILLEGDSGIGKTEIVLKILASLGYEEMHNYELPASSQKPFYHISVGLDQDKKVALLVKAFHEGAIVVIDEINSCPMMESLLNDLVMGRYKGEKPQNPGFMIIGTQNPVSMAGRRVAGMPFLRRFSSMEVIPYPHQEMLEILLQKGAPKNNALAMIAAFNKNLAYAIKNHLSPLPTFADVVELVQKLKDKGELLHRERIMPFQINRQDTLVEQLKPVVNSAFKDYNIYRKSSEFHHKKWDVGFFAEENNNFVQADSLVNAVNAANDITSIVDLLKNFLARKNEFHYDYSFKFYLADNLVMLINAHCKQFTIKPNEASLYTSKQIETIIQQLDGIAQGVGREVQP